MAGCIAAALTWGLKKAVQSQRVTCVLEGEGSTAGGEAGQHIC